MSVPVAAFRSRRRGLWPVDDPVQRPRVVPRGGRVLHLRRPLRRRQRRL